MAEQKKGMNASKAKGPLNLKYFAEKAGFTETEKQYLYHCIYKGAKIALPKEKLKKLIGLIKDETVEITNQLTLLAKNGK